MELLLLCVNYGKREEGEGNNWISIWDSLQKTLLLSPRGFSFRE
jgi:hypothetical protein